MLLNRSLITTKFSFGGKMKITAPKEAVDGFSRILDKFKK